MLTPDERLGNPPVDLLWIFAHPDDESFGSAGLMAWAHDNGLRTAYICATRGEAGGIRDSALATQETLGAVREHELRTAMAQVGLSEIRILGFRDSGMESTIDNDHPMALVNQPAETLLVHLAGHIRDLRPTTVITFGPEGIYGHPDHKYIGELACRAVSLAADPEWMPALHTPWQASALYFSVVPRELIMVMADDPAQPLGEISDESRRNLGTPSAEITHWIDVEPWIDIKRQAVACHRTQVDPDEVLSADSDEAIAKGMGHEHFLRQPLPWDRAMSDPDPITVARDTMGSSGPPAGHPVST